MAPEKTDPDSGEDSPNTSTLSLDTSTNTDTEREPYFEPVVHLPEVEVKTNEEDEEQLFKMRCKLFRFCNDEAPGEWKERGTGDIKVLHHHEKKTVRIIMRQDKTLKIRANHYITPYMELLPNCDSDRAYVWSSNADFADEQTKSETFAIKFANSDHAKSFKEKFNEARNLMTVYVVDEKKKGRSQSDESAVPGGNKPEICAAEPDSPKPSCGDVEKKLEKLSVADEAGDETRKSD